MCNISVYIYLYDNLMIYELLSSYLKNIVDPPRLVLLFAEQPEYHENNGIQLNKIDWKINNRPP